MKKISKYFVLLACSALALASCNKEENAGGGSSTDGYFFSQVVSFNLLSNKDINIPIVRLGTSGDLTVGITSEGPSIFSLPTSVTIKDGERMANIPVSYNISDIAYNTDYTINVKVNDFKSQFGYETLTAVIQYPTSYYLYGKGHITEGWWAEEEDKDMFARDFLGSILQCYLPDCWGHDSGGPDYYDVQDYVFYWDTESNKVYVPYQFMGSGTTYIADRGAAHALAAGVTEGTAEWFSYIDDYYAKSGEVQPSYNPETKKFNLSDCYDVKEDGSYSECNFDTLIIE